MNSSTELEAISESKSQIPYALLWKISAAILALMLIASLWAGSALPESGRFSIHWGADGKPNGYGSKNMALWMNPAIALILSLILSVMPQLDPRKFNIQQSAKVYGIAWISLLAFFLVLHLAMLCAALGCAVNMNYIVMPLVGLLFMVLGNYLGKIQSNFTIGIRTPWTLSSELAWNKTHRLGGRLFFIFGLALILTSTLPKLSQWIVPMLIGGLAIITIMPVAFSYIVWKREKKAS